MLETERLILRNWEEADAEALYRYAKDPAIGPVAGWPPHVSVQNSLEVIRQVMCGAECYAICEKGNPAPIGAIELKMKEKANTTDRDDECELGFWMGVPFWGRGFMTEAGKEVLRHGFEDLGMRRIWCGYYAGNDASRRVQEKLGFIFDHTLEHIFVELMDEFRTEHVNVLTREQWLEMNQKK